MPPMNPTGRHGPKRRRHGEGTVVRRRPRRLADGTLREPSRPWAAVVPWTDESGRRRETWLSAASRAEAEAIRRREVARLARVRPTALTVAEYVAGWLDTLEVGPGTMPRYRAHLDERIAPTVGHVRLDALTPQQCRRAVASWAGAPATRAGALRLLRAAMRQAVRDRAREFDPTEGIAAPRTPPRTATTLTAAQARQLMAEVEGERLAPVLVVSLGLGLRRGEALGLMVSDVDLDAGTVTIARQLRYVAPEFRGDSPGEPYRIRGTKTGRTRVLPLPAFVADALRARLEERERERKAARVWAENGTVFCAPNGNTIPPNTLYSWYKNPRTGALKRAGLPDCSWHSLRATTATLLIEMGVDLSTVQRILGHSSVHTTMRYIGDTPEALRGAADRLGRAIGNG